MTTKYNSVGDMIKKLCWHKAMNAGGIDGYSNYIGPDYSKYIVLLSRSRDSNTLADSNFESAKAQFKGNRGVITARFNHWACGWFELLLVSKTAKKSLKIALDINNALDDYPVLDENDLSEREQQAQNETWEGNKESMMRDIWGDLFGAKKIPNDFDFDFEQLTYALYEADCNYRGIEDGWARLDCGWIGCDNLKSNKYINALNSALKAKKKA